MQQDAATFLTPVEFTALLSCLVSWVSSASAGLRPSSQAGSQTKRLLCSVPRVGLTERSPAEAFPHSSWQPSPSSGEVTVFAFCVAERFVHRAVGLDRDSLSLPRAAARPPIPSGAAWRASQEGLAGARDPGVHSGLAGLSHRSSVWSAEVGQAPGLALPPQVRSSEGPEIR